MSKRVRKLEGYQGNKNTEPVFNLPPGKYIVSVGEGSGEYIEINISKGPAGLGVRLNTWRSSEPLTVEMEGAQAYPRPDVYEVNVTRYYTDEPSQEFKRWYNTHPDQRDFHAPVLPIGAP